MVTDRVHLGHGFAPFLDMDGVSAQGTSFLTEGILPHVPQEHTLLIPVPDAGADAHADPGWHGQSTQGPCSSREGDHAQGSGGDSVLGAQDVRFRRFAAFVRGRRAVALRRAFELWRAARVLRIADQFIGHRGPG